MNNVIQLLTLAIVSFGFLLALRLVFTARNEWSSIYLGFYILILVGMAVEIFLKGKWFLQIIGLTYWMVGPLVFFFIRSKLNPESIQIKSFFVHLAPLAVYLLLMIFESMRGPFIDPDVADVIVYEVLFIHILAYLAVAMRLFRKRRHRVKSPDFFSKMDDSFSVFLPAGSFILFGLPFMLTNLRIFNLVPFTERLAMLIQLVLISFLIAIAFLNTEYLSRPGERVK